MDKCVYFLIFNNCTMNSVTCSDLCVVNLGINADNEMRGIKINTLFSSIKYYQNNLPEYFVFNNRVTRL